MTAVKAMIAVYLTSVLTGGSVVTGRSVGIVIDSAAGTAGCYHDEMIWGCCHSHPHHY